jgi:hypothetical protein
MDRIKDKLSVNFVTLLVLSVVKFTTEIYTENHKDVVLQNKFCLAYRIFNFETASLRWG